MPCSSMAVQSCGMTRGVTRGHPEAQPCPVPPKKGERKGRRSLQPCLALPYLQAAVHHADDKVELLVVQHGAVLLHVQVQLLGQALPGCPALHGTQHGREQLWDGVGGVGWGLHSPAPTPSSVWAHTGVTGCAQTLRQKFQLWPAGHGHGGGKGAQGHWEMEQELSWCRATSQNPGNTRKGTRHGLVVAMAVLGFDGPRGIPNPNGPMVLLLGWEWGSAPRNRDSRRGNRFKL